MLNPSGSRAFAQEVRRNPLFFEPVLVSLGTLLAGIVVVDLVTQTAQLAAIVAGVFLGWCVVRLKPLAQYVSDESRMARRPLLTVCVGFLVVLFIGGMWSVVRTGEPLHGQALASTILVASTTGAPIGAAYWMDRYGKAAAAKRRRMRSARPSA